MSDFCRGDQHTWSDEVVGYRKTNGLIVAAEECTTCGHVRTLVGVKMSQQEAVGLRLARDRMGEKPPCERCGAPDAELHHYAPRAAFGGDSETWPKGWLCRACHKQWHDTIRQWAGGQA